METICSFEKSPLYPIVNPRSIAIFGGSNNIMSMGTSLLNAIKALGFEGDVYPVHPKEKEVLQLKAYRSVLDLPEVPDLAILVLPTQVVPEIMEACGRKGIKHVIVVSGGFREVGGDGVVMEEKVLEIAHRYGIRFLGPNCIGVANPHHKLNTTFFHYLGAPGFIGMASQSGSFVTQMFHYLSGFGLGFSTALSVGNEADIDLVDCLEYLGNCPHTKVIALYIEDIKRGRGFIKTARSIVPHKPIVALYAGGSETGKRASLSHTGAMGGPDRLYDGMFRQLGIVRARSITELFDFCWALGSLPRPKGRKVIIQTHSGGPGVAAADSIGRAGFHLPPLSRETREKLGPFMPHTASIKNPIDLTFNKNPIDYFSDIPKALLEERNADILLIYFFMPSLMVKRALKHIGFSEEEVIDQSRKIIDEQCRAISELLQAYDKPVVGFTFRSFNEYFIKGLIKNGVTVFPGPERAARALKALSWYYSMKERIQTVTST